MGRMKEKKITGFYLLLGGQGQGTGDRVTKSTFSFLATKASWERPDVYCGKC